MRDMLSEIYDLLRTDSDLAQITIRSFERPETLQDNETSIVIIPITPPTDALNGSDTVLQKKFMYQINVESVKRIQAKEIQNKISKLLREISFYQTDGGLEDYISSIGRYVDARTYRGRSPLYKEY